MRFQRAEAIVAVSLSANYLLRILPEDKHGICMNSPILQLTYELMSVISSFVILFIYHKKFVSCFNFTR